MNKERGEEEILRKSKGKNRGGNTRKRIRGGEERGSTEKEQEEEQGEYMNEDEEAGFAQQKQSSLSREERYGTGEAVAGKNRGAAKPLRTCPEQAEGLVEGSLRRCGEKPRSFGGTEEYRKEEARK